jgi:pilus assembly protein CpaF
VHAAAAGGENVGTGFVVPTVASCVDLVVHLAKDAPGSGGCARSSPCPGRVEGDVVEVADLFVTRGPAAGARRRLPARTRERFEWAGIDLPRLLAQDGAEWAPSSACCSASAAC